MKATVIWLALAGCVPETCDSPSAECSRMGGFLEPIPETCSEYRERTATQPRFCNDLDRDPRRHCFTYVRRCQYRCVVHEGRP